LKITDLKVRLVRHELPSGRPVPEGPRGSIAVVTVETDEGITGIGDAMTHSIYHEAALAVKVIIERGLKNLLIGENPADVRRLWWKMYHSEMYARQGGLALNAISAVDTALMDILGKAANQPVCRLLGGKQHSKIQVYASDLFDMARPEKTIRLVNRLVDEKFKAIKLGYGGFGLDVDESINMIRMIRDSIGYDVALMVDGPRSLSVSEAIKLGRKLERYEVFWWEEPLPKTDIDGYVKLTESLDIKIAAGEQLQTAYEFKEWITRRAVDIIQPDVHIAGGLSECRRISDLAEIWNIPLVPHSWSTAINFAAALHLVASMKRPLFVEYRTLRTPLMTELLREPIRIENGYVEVPEKPGLGIELNEETISMYELKTQV
jgi:L-alanine-DL-glutamate epimerase-like enolase superfamily enzyme